jgi:hypothetical protein
MNPDAADATDEALVAAYLATRWVMRTEPIEIRIGDAASAAALLERLDASAAAIVTAWNPRSRRLTAARNRARNARLLRDIASRGWRRLECDGVGAAADGGEWREASYVVADPALADAVELGRRYEQNAVVWWRRGAAPVLIATTPGFAARSLGERIEAREA